MNKACQNDLPFSNMFSGLDIDDFGDDVESFGEFI